MEMLTTRHNFINSLFYDFFGPSFTEIWLTLAQNHFYLLPRDSPRDKYRFPVYMSQTSATMGELFNANSMLLSGAQNPILIG
jgi:hypothetical protein